MSSKTALVLALVLLLGFLSLPGTGAVADETVTVYYDDFGIPHIYAKTAEAGLYASGWAQATDRLEAILKNYSRALGEYSAAFGPGEGNQNYRADLESLMQKGGSTREVGLGRERGQHDAVQVAGLETCGLERAAGGLLAQLGRGGSRLDPAALRDPGPLANPLVARVHQLRQVVIGDDPVGHVHPGSGDLRAFHALSP